jgi:tetratricopeptide (TPR) repeat protein
MARSKTKSIATVLQIVLGLVLVAVLGLLLNMLAGNPILSSWVNANPGHSLKVLLWVAIAVIVFGVLLELWKHFSPNADEPVTRNDLDTAIRKMLEGRYESAVKEGRIPEQAFKEKDAEITRLTEELQKLQQQLAARSSEPSEVKLSKLLAAGDLDAALYLKSQQVQKSRGASGNLPRDLYILGLIHEIRFEWPQALASYREAWELGHDPAHGFKYARFAQDLNHFSEAIAAYEALLRIYKGPPDRAKTLNNLGNLYRDTQRIRESEEVFSEALSTYRNLAETNPETYLSYVAMTLNNQAIVFRTTRRIREAEQAYDEALVILRNLTEINPETQFGIATTLNNLANLYSHTQRMKESEQAYIEALSIFRKLAETNPDAYLPYVANTLNNLANIYSDTQRMKEAEQAYDEALTIYCKLAVVNPEIYMPYEAAILSNLANLYAATLRVPQAEQAYIKTLATYRKLTIVNPDAYMHDLALTLNNLGALRRAAHRIQEAEEAYDEALTVFRKLVEVNPTVYISDVAMTLNNLGGLYGATQRLHNAERAYSEALAIRCKLAQANPDAFLPDVASTQNNLANLYFSTGRIQEATTHASEAERILEPLWQANLELHGNQMAKILLMRALIFVAAQKPAAEACALARRALAAAYDPALKQSIQQLIDRLCPPS